MNPANTAALGYRQPVTGQFAVENRHISPIVVDAVLGVIADNGVGDCQIRVKSVNFVGIAAIIAVFN